MSKTNIKPPKKSILQFIQFNLVGILNTAVDFSVFSLLILVGMNRFVAQPLSYSCGITNSYFWNKYWTFQAKSQIKVKEVLKFILVNLVSLGVSIVLFYLFDNIFSEIPLLQHRLIFIEMNVLLTKILATFGAMVVNFFGNKFWVFTMRGK